MKPEYFRGRSLRQELAKKGPGTTDDLIPFFSWEEGYVGAWPFRGFARSKSGQKRIKLLKFSVENAFFFSFIPEFPC